MSNLSIATNALNDIFIGMDGNLATVRNLQAVLQDCEHAMKAQLGEMVLATTKGLPTMDTVWLQQRLPQFDAAARKTLRAINGVTDVPSFASIVMQNTLVYRAVISTEYGTGIVTNG